jgi:hypothetical protein
MHILASAVILMFLAAGCSGPPSTADNPSTSAAPGQPSDAPELRFATGWLNETFTSLEGPILFYGLTGANCVNFEHRDLRRIHQGWANVSWTSPSALAEIMELNVQWAGPSLGFVGASPMSVSLQDLESHEIGGLAIFLQTEDLAGTDLEAGADIEVDMHLQWAFYYEGTDSLVHGRAGCG